MSVDDAESVGALELLDCVKYGLFEVDCFGVVLFDEVGDDFGVGVGGELNILVGELFFEFEVVFNDAVVDNGELLVLAEERVGVFVGGGAVCGPTRMAYANVAWEGG